MKPRIAVTVASSEAKSSKWLPYLNAIRDAGGEPELVYGHTEPPDIERLLQRFDGLLMPGGRDVAPEEYGGRPHPAVNLDAADRDSFELEAARVARREQLPTLGICRGMQMMNVALGGTLYEDIPDQYEPPNGLRIGHQQIEAGHHRSDRTHPVDVTAGSRVASIAGGRCVDTNSTHHQAVRRIPYDLLAVAKTRDGIVEAVELREAHPFYIGVQWHPEELVANDEPSRRIFKAFVQAAADRAAKR